MNTAIKLGPPTHRHQLACPCPGVGLWALSIMQKPLHYRGIHLNSCPAFVYVDLCSVFFRARVSVHEVLDRAPSPFLAAALVVHCRALFLSRGAQAIARRGARCASELLDRCARPLPAAPIR
jgi:hypothetical protein